MVIDSHQHFWKYSPVKHAWIDDSMAVLQNDFLPNDLEPILKENGIEGCVAVQAEESTGENDFLLKLAAENAFIRGVVGWIDMLDENMPQVLEQYRDDKKMKGFRYVLQDKPSRDLMLAPVFKNNLSYFNCHRFTYDILIFRDQLLFADELAKQFSNQPLVLDHLGKPAVKMKELQQWKRDITALAKNENVFCKLSGLVTEADWHHFTEDDLKPYMETALEVFGTKRLMYGSDWPVCTLAASYNRNYQFINNFISKLSVAEQHDIMGKTAAAFYNL